MSFTFRFFIYENLFRNKENAWELSDFLATFSIILGIMKSLNNKILEQLEFNKVKDLLLPYLKT
ncbi:hypothetical protein E0F54_09125 [Streptococcus pyogenes]|nr:hypothetical protein E0F54_09125 [Streptococcus pyogenes]